MAVYPGQYTRSRRTQDPRHYPGARVEDHIGRVLVYGRALTECTVGQIVAPNLYATLTSGVTASVNTTEMTSSGSAFVKRVEDINGKVTTVERPLRGSLVHVYLGTGKEQFARVTDVLTTTKLGVQVIGREGPTYGGSWGTAVATTDDVRIIEPHFAPYDISSHSLPPVGYTLPDTIEAGSWGFFGAKGIFRCVPSSTVINTPMMVGTTAGQIEPRIMLGVSTAKDLSNIPDGDMEAEVITVTGAALGDFVQATHSLDVTDLTVSATVTAANTVTVVVENNTGAGVDLAAGDITVKVDAQVALAEHECGKLYSPPNASGESALVSCDLPPAVLWGQWTV